MISVIMLTFNRENLVGRAIECILSQTYKDFEFIIVDNGSIDKSGFVADSYAKIDSRIRVIHRDRGSISSGRNTGLDESRGDYIAFIDDDDTYSADFLQFLYDLIVENDADVSICGSSSANVDEKYIMTAEQAMIMLLHRKNYNVAFPTKMIKKTLFDSLRFPEDVKYDDIYLMPKVLARAKKVAYHGKAKYHFNRHSGNNSAWTQNHRLLDLATLEEYLKVYSDRTKWLCEIFPDNVDSWKYFNWSFMLSMLEKINRYSLKDCEQIAEELLKELFANREQILSSKLLQDFERQWMRELVLKL